MLIKFICCDVFARIACDLVARSPHIIDLEFVPMLAHTKPATLNRMIADKISESFSESGRKYEALILGYGLCGNSVIGLSCPVPMIIPRAHDCCTIQLGSKERFAAVFGDMLSARWSSTGYHERCHALGSANDDEEQLASYKTSTQYMKYVEQYGEEDADYIWETMHPAMETDKGVYIKIDGFEYSNALEEYKSRLDKMDKQLIVADGDVSMLKALIDGEWDDGRFLIVPPGKKIAGIYDMDEVMAAGD